ncbi:pilus assembly protein TadG-related protein [Cellulomonas sp. P22]|uniref:pilus assembly protein TadG-related protein n=1 Tax=Cellulomonas sp. P22 TaxID=3373189 RepID=UPI00378EB68E
MNAPAPTRWSAWRLLGRSRRPVGDDGQTTILAIGFMVLALLLVTAVVSATGVHLDRKRLLATADAAALAGADALADPTYFDDGLVPTQDGGAVPLTDAEVRRVVERYLADHPEVGGGLEGLQVLDATSPDGHSAEVRLGALSRPVLLSWVTAPWSDGIVLEASSTARGW